MKKTLLMSAALWMSAAAFALTPVMGPEISKGTDCEVFLAPYVESALKDLSGKVVLDAGCGVTPHSDVALSVRLIEVAQSMKEGDRILFAAPASYGVLFTDGKVTEEAAKQHIQQVVNKIGKSKDASLIVKALSELKEVTRATFAHENGHFKLITDEKTLKAGQPIWCKTPEGVIASSYQSEENCLVALRHAGFSCEEIKRPCFFGKVKYDQWQASSGKTLGQAYMNHHPFTLYYAVKKA